MIELTKHNWDIKKKQLMLNYVAMHTLPMDDRFFIFNNCINSN